MKSADWHILGAGALGCLWGGYLHKSGQCVELLIKDASLFARFQATNRITLRHGDSREELPVNASVVDQGATDIRQLLITTKAHQTMTALHAIAPRLHAECRLLLLQNGMGVAEQIAAAYPRHPLFCGVTTDGAYCPEPYTVVHAGRGETYIGGFQNRYDPRRLLAQLPVDFLAIHACDDIESRQWRKLAINCAVNGLTVVFHCRNGELLNIEAARTRLSRLCDEIARLGEKLGFKEWRDTLYANTVDVIRMTAANYSSMYQDINNRRVTEIDYINGYLIQQARRFGVACPENEALYREIKETEQRLNCNP